MCKDSCGLLEKVLMCKLDEVFDFGDEGFKSVSRVVIEEVVDVGDKLLSSTSSRL